MFLFLFFIFPEWEQKSYFIKDIKVYSMVDYSREYKCKGQNCKDIGFAYFYYKPFMHLIEYIISNGCFPTLSNLWNKEIQS